MNGLGGLNKSPEGVVIGLVQLQLPTVVTPDDLARQTARIVEMVCTYTYMQDLVAGRYRLPWEDQIKPTDGASCGFPRPTRRYGEKTG